MRWLTVLLVLYVLVGSIARAQEASSEEFKEYCKIWKGRWIGDVTWVTDWPGLGKRGEKATAYWDATVPEDGNALQGRFFGGGGSGTVLHAFDAGSKSIRSIAVTSAGTVWNCVYFKRDGKWVQKSVGSNADGTKIEGESVLTITDGGKTLTWTGSGTTGGKKNDDQRDVWKRLSN